MARAATTADAFNAIAEPRRREILGLLAHGERSVTEVVQLVRLPQPQVSKHLGVLRSAGLVDVRGEGRMRFYRINAEQLRPVYDWVRTFERFWEHQLDAIKRIAEQKARDKQKQDRANHKH